LVAELARVLALMQVPERTLEVVASPTCSPRLVAVLQAAKDRVLLELVVSQAFSEAVRELALVPVLVARARVKTKPRLVVPEISPAFSEA
jgi:hypothetical protein